MEVLAAFLNGKSMLWYHPESDCHFIDYEEATDGLSVFVAELQLKGNVLRVHFPELYEAHKLRDREFLTRMAANHGLTYEEFEASNWDSEGNLEMSEIETDVPPPAEPPKAKRGRKPGVRNTKKSTQAEQLVTALEFVSAAHSDLQEFSQYVNLTKNMAVMYNGQIAAGHPIVEELTLSPHLEKMKAALLRCGKSLVITETMASQISVKGEKLRALVPCWLEPLALPLPDAPVLSGDFDALKEAFKVCGTLVSEAATEVMKASLLLEPNTCTGTDGFAMLQYWHGVNIPPGTVVSKLFAAAVAKQSKKITGVGAHWDSEAGFARSLTLWFEGGAWIKTQCYNDRWKNIDHILNVPTAAVPVPPTLFEAIEAVENFTTESNAIYFMQDFVQSHEDANIGAQYEVEGLPGGKAFNGKFMRRVSPWVKTIDLTSDPVKAFFFGGEPSNPVRGVLMGIGPAR